jgi:hypothetical protein
MLHRDESQGGLNVLIQTIAMRVRGKIGLTYHSGKMSKVCSKWFHPEYCYSISITFLGRLSGHICFHYLTIRHLSETK